VIVVDASAALAALLNAGLARRALGSEQLHVPHLIDSEVANGLRRKVAGEEISPEAGWAALDVWRRLGMIRYPLFAVLGRVWQLRANLRAYDASYVALAERLDCSLLTSDVRLAPAPGVRCPVTVVPHSADRNDGRSIPAFPEVSRLDATSVANERFPDLVFTRNAEQRRRRRFEACPLGL